MLKRHEADHVWVGSDRGYLLPDGRRFPGVTTVLSRTKPESTRASLEKWRRNYDAEHGEGAADQYRDSCAARGTGMHALIEAELAPEQADAEAVIAYADDPVVAPFYESMRPVLDSLGEVLLVEGAVWHARKFAGSADCLAIVDGELTLVDWKSSAKPKRRDYIGDYFCQAAAYTAAINERYAADNVLVERALIAVALADKPAQTFAIERDELLAFWDLFKQRVERFYGR